MKAAHAPSLLLATLSVGLTITSAYAQKPADIPASISTPDRVESSRLGTLNFKDGR